MSLTNLGPGQTMKLTNSVTYSIMNEGVSGGVTSFGAYTVTWADPPLEAAYSIGPAGKTTLDVSQPPTQATLVNTGGTTLQVFAPDS